MLSAVVVLDGWGAGSLTSNFHPKLTWVAHCVGYTRGILYSVRLQGCFNTRCSPSINMHLYSLVHTHTPDSRQCQVCSCLVSTAEHLVGHPHRPAAKLQSSQQKWYCSFHGWRQSLQPPRMCTGGQLYRQTDTYTGRCSKRQDND